MSRRTVWVAGAGIAMAAALCASDARAQFYLGAEGGWTGLEGTRDKIDGVTIHRSFNGGYNVGARAGYQMGPWRFEGEYSYRANGSNLTRFGDRFNGTLDTNSFMANAIYDFNVGWPLTPHIGMGIGGSALNGNLNGPAIGYRSKTSDVVFAYQAIAGIRYMINPTLAFDLDYRYRGSADATYHARAFTLAGVAVPARTYNGVANSNNVVASLSYLFGAPPPPPYAPPPMPPPPQAARVFLVFFDWSKDTVTPEGMGIIQQAAAAFKAGGPVQIQVTGYTDRSGSPAYNQRLSERRAANVAKALAGMGVPQSQMAVSGHGENDNRVPTADGVREPQNRRVEIIAS
jgi:OmpA-OmpF porin, OOP family